MSRDDAEPDASLRVASAALATLAAKPKDAPQVPPRARGLRTLHGALCAEGGAPRVTFVGAGALSCGPSRALEEGGLAEVRALAAMGQPLAAAVALGRAQQPPATKTSTRTKDAEGWVLQAAPAVVASSVRQVAAVPLVERGNAPAWGALAFEPSGKLLVRTANGVVRADPETGDEAEARDLAPWSATVASPDGASRLAEVFDPCDGVSLHATLAPIADGAPQDIALPLPPLVGSRCAGGRAEPVRALPVAWGTSGLELLVDGAAVLVGANGRASVQQAPMAQAAPPGSPRAWSGTWTLAPTPLGLVAQGRSARTLRSAAFEGEGLRDCAISGDGSRAACVKGASVWVGTWPPPKAP